LIDPVHRLPSCLDPDPKSTDNASQNREGGSADMPVINRSIPAGQKSPAAVAGLIA
jgi:hypothetical protein